MATSRLSGQLDLAQSFTGDLIWINAAESKSITIINWRTIRRWLNLYDGETLSTRICCGPKASPERNPILWSFLLTRVFWLGLAIGWLVFSGSNSLSEDRSNEKGGCLQMVFIRRSSKGRRCCERRADASAQIILLHMQLMLPKCLVIVKSYSPQLLP